jgi:hypothetical protein
MSRTRYGRDIDKRHARTRWNRRRQASTWQLGRESKHARCVLCSGKFDSVKSGPRSSDLPTKLIPKQILESRLSRPRCCPHCLSERLNLEYAPCSRIEELRCKGISRQLTTPRPAQGAEAAGLLPRRTPPISSTRPKPFG